jgi:dienelactone hydrolase
MAGDPRLNADLQTKLSAYLPLETPSERQAAAKEIAGITDAWPAHFLERAHRSQRQPKGLIVDQVLTLASETNPEAVYTLYVPSTYDPLKATPLVVGLHGGGPGGKDRTGVVGSGPSAMNFFQQAASKLGWIIVCPTAQRASWNNPANDGFIKAVVDEMCALYNIDTNRIYLAGHSMGGYGTWHFGPRYAEIWAAISPNSGGGRPNLKHLRDTQTGVYLHHGADDNVVGVSNDRDLADQMLKSEMDFVYCEIPDSGHGWPDDVREEMFEFLKVRRLAVPGRGGFRITETIESSFQKKQSKEELEAFGAFFEPPMGAPTTDEAKTLLSQLQKGGGRALRASARLAQLHDSKIANDVAKILSNEKNNTDVRRYAADALGMMEQDSVLKTLRRAASDESLRVAAAAAIAIGRLKDPDAGKALDSGLQSLAKSFQSKLVGRSMDFTDYNNHLVAASGWAFAVEARGAPLLGATLQNLLTIFLDDSVQVPESERAGQNADTSRRQLAKAVLSACRAGHGAEAKTVLESLSKLDSLGVSKDAQELLKSVGAN